MPENMNTFNLYRMTCPLIQIEKNLKEVKFNSLNTQSNAIKVD